jgi:hypothetical protein
VESRLPWVEMIADIPVRPPAIPAEMADDLIHIVSHQHPDHDTDPWPPTV